MENITKKIKKFPSSPGVYIFKNKNRQILYIGKAASLKDRVGSYFKRNLAYERPIEFVINQIASVETKQTETVLEAYFLEQELIKKHQPKYNILGKDDKSFCYAVITKEEFPHFEIIRKTDLDKLKTESQSQCLKIRSEKYLKVYGPFTSKKLLAEALQILRRIFPYHNRKQKTEKGCLDFQIGLCPGPYAGKISRQDYMKNIHSIEMIFKGRKFNLLKKLEKEMKHFAKEKEYEKAAERRNQLFALKHIRDISLLNNEHFPKTSVASEKIIRVEGYDISNISGQYATGSMVVFEGNIENLEPNKDQYRKFKIKTVAGIDDVGAMKEVLERRFKNNWPLPDLILIDGGKGHLNATKKVLFQLKLNIPILAVAKGPTRKKLDLYSSGRPFPLSKNIITQIRNEAHRFAITYHRKLREKI